MNMEEPIGPDRHEADAALAESLKSLAHPKRLRLLRFVAEPRSLEEIASELRVTRQSAKEHLDRLVEAGLVEPRRGQGRHGPVTQYVVVVARAFDIHDRLGTQLGVVHGNLNEDVQSRLPTTTLDAAGPSAIARDAPRLIVVHGMRVGQTKPLQGNGPWLMGRDPAATLCLDYDPYVSHRHAEVRRGAKGFELVDALSSNGVFVDWDRVPRGGVVPLPNGSLLRLGKTLVLFRVG